MSVKRQQPGSDEWRCRRQETSSQTERGREANAGLLAPKPADFTKEQELAAYRDMLLIRRFEEKAGQLYGMGFIGGFCHLYIGQEAVVTGMKMALIEGDQMITAYRDHGHMLAMEHVAARRDGRADRPPRRLFARARAARCTCSPRRSISTAATASSARRCRSAPASPSPTATASNKNVSLTYFGDGAANQGQVYESFNMAALWKLPVIYVIENNRYAMGTSVARSSAETDFSQRGAVLQHSRHAGRRHGCARGQGRRRRRDRMVPLGQGPDHPGNADLPLSRPLHVRPGEVPLEGRGPEDALRARSDRAGEGAPAREEVGERGRAEGDRQGGARHRRRRRRIRQTDPEPDASELWTDIVH